MNKFKQLPRKGPSSPRIINNSFPKAFPIYWGPNQKILENDVYVEPSGFKDNRILAVPKIARFIHDAHQETTAHEGCIAAGVLNIEGFARPSATYPPYGEHPWASIGSSGRWYPDATVWFATTVPIVHRDEFFNVTLLENMPVSAALAGGYLEYWAFLVNFGWFTGSGFITSAELIYTDTPPAIDESGHPDLIARCDSAPVGCPCTGDP